MLVELLIAASKTKPVVAPSVTVWPAIIGAVISVVTIVALITYGRKYISAQGVKAQLDAKDAVIATNKQSIESLEGRLSTLEKDFAGVNIELETARGRIQDLESALVIQVQRYDDLTAFAAPEALDAVQRTLNEQARHVQKEHRAILSALEHVVVLIERISQRIGPVTSEG